MGLQELCGLMIMFKLIWLPGKGISPTAAFQTLLAPKALLISTEQVL